MVLTSDSNASAGGRPAATQLAVAGGIALLLYLWVALALPVANSSRAIGLFLLLFGVQFGLYAAAWRRARRGGFRAIGIVLLFAALFRLALLPAGLPHDRHLEALEADLSSEETGYDKLLLYDNDAWRYLWDGHLVRHGIDPWALTPRQHAEALELVLDPPPPLEEPLWEEILDNVSFQGHTSVYPPLAQALFALTTFIRPGSVFLLKLLLAAADFGTCLLLARLARRLGRPPSAVLAYAWNPLVVKEIAGSGHVDALMVLLLVAAVTLMLERRPALGLATLAASCGAKLGGVLLAPLWMLRSPPARRWVFPAALAVVFLPALPSWRPLLDGLRVYGRDWIFNSGPWAALRATAAAAGADNPDLWAHGIGKGILLAAVLLGLRAARGSDIALIDAAFTALAVAVLLHPAVMPWYLLWPLPFAALTGRWSWFALTALALLSYLFYVDGVERSWWLWVEYGGYALCLGAEKAVNHGPPAVTRPACSA